MRVSSALRASPERAFETLYERHAAHVYRYALALLGSPADAEEVTQTAFLNAYRALGRGERPRNASAWLHTIALNLCRQRFRQAARRPSEVPLEDDVVDLVADPEDPTIEDVTRALKHLPFNQRAALVMREFEGRSPPEIARSLGLTTSAVEALLFRARRSLREQLEGGLTCQQAERALSLQLDGALARGERGSLRAHLRECRDCARLARSMRGQRGALKSLAVLPLPSAMASAPQVGAGASLAGAGAPLLGGAAAKLAVGFAAAALLGGAGYQAIRHRPAHAVSQRPTAPSPPGSASPAARAPATAPARRLPGRPKPAAPRRSPPAPARPSGQIVNVPVLVPVAAPGAASGPHPSRSPKPAHRPNARPKLRKAKRAAPKPAKQHAAKQLKQSPPFGRPISKPAPGATPPIKPPKAR